MLTMIYSLGKLPFRSLMAVYEEGNQENGEERYPEEPPERQLALAEEDFYEYLRNVFFPTPGAWYALWTEEGRCVSAVRLEPYGDGLLLEALETAPDMRNRGFASALVTALLEQVEAPVYSHVSKRNMPSLAVHKKCGFRKFLDHAVYIDGSINSRCVTLRWEKPFSREKMENGT